MKREDPKIGMVRQKVLFLSFANKSIISCCVPSQVDIKVNEKADSATKSALDLACVKYSTLISVSYQPVYPAHLAR